MTQLRSRPTLRYRAYQFFVAINALRQPNRPLAAGQRQLIARVLPQAEQQALFQRMSANDQRHGLAVAQMLIQAGHQELSLLQAALLHDVAKSLGQPIIHRVAIVVLHRLWPQLLQHLCRCEPPQTVVDVNGWRRPFVVHAHHPDVGAAWAAAAGCEPLTVQLIALHQEKLPSEPRSDEERLLLALQWADDQN